MVLRIPRGGWRFSNTGVLEGILFALYERFEIEGGRIAVVKSIGAQTIERRLCQIAKSAEVGLLRLVEAATVLTEDGLDASFYFSMALRRKLREVRRLLFS